MKLEVLVNEDEPKIYQLDRPKIVIGSHESCDIIIGDQLVSRKHIVVYTQGNQYFISDQASRNGTFINEEKLVPGKKTEFTSYFPVRLGQNVLLTLMSDEEASDLGEALSLNDYLKSSDEVIPEEKTVTVTRNHIRKNSTEQLKKAREESLVQRKVVTKKKRTKRKRDSLLKPFLFFVVLGGLIAYQRWNKIVPPQEVAPVVVAKPVVAAQKVSLDDLPAVEMILSQVKSPKCSLELEKYLCSLLPSINYSNFGPIVRDKDIIIFADASKYFESARDILARKSEIQDVKIMALMIWVKENIPDTMTNFKGLENNRLTVTLVDNSKETPEIEINATFVPDSLLLLRQRMKESDFENAKKNGVLEFYYRLDYARFF